MRYLTFVCAINSFVKETPHFLVTKGRHEEAEALFHHIAKVNGKSVPDGMMEQLKEDEKSAVTEKLKSIIHAPVLLIRTAIFLYLWYDISCCCIITSIFL